MDLSHMLQACGVSTVSPHVTSAGVSAARSPHVTSAQGLSDPKSPPPCWHPIPMPVPKHCQRPCPPLPLPLPGPHGWQRPLSLGRAGRGCPRHHVELHQHSHGQRPPEPRREQPRQ